MNVIEIQPDPAQRRAFARWAVAQVPKIRTISPTSFAVPADRFTDAPEDILIGALVDGHRYVSPEEDAAVGNQPPETVVPGEPMPEVPASAYPPDSGPLPELPEDSDSSDSAPDVPDGVFPCSGCEREFTSQRGRDMHHRQKHAED
ncbi:hypothetical protein [Streptomyces anulatus]|uniref:hypothetical protein n=1 Tax=Streptomyces anulatus TaxID=1892 RepID=UPI0036AB1209